MTDLVACLSSGENSRSHVSRLIREEEWKRIFLITDGFRSNDFNPGKEVEFIVVDFHKPVSELIRDIKDGLSGKISDMEVALNIVSGTGKEHMAILSALLKLGLGIRLMAVTREGIREL